MALKILLIIVLIMLTAFFVATEFAIVKIRPSRVNQLCAEGHKKALVVKEVTSNLDEYLSACQLGITITALGLGWLGKPTFEVLLNPVFAYYPIIPSQISHIISFAVAFFIITFLHVVIGELAPKTLAIQKAEQVTLIVARPIIWFYKFMYPFIWLLNGSAGLLIRFFGLHSAKDHDEVHSEEELRLIMIHSFNSGEINADELQYVNRIFEFDSRLAREIMVPRTDMVCLDIDDSIEENLDIILQQKYTRFPVIKGDNDHVLGFINTKELFIEHYKNKSNIDLRALTKPMLVVSESIFIKNLLTQMQESMSHIAVLIDEYGGTEGIVTIEDILEEIVGEIRDEFDHAETIDVVKVNEGHYKVNGNLLLEKVNDLLNLDIDSLHSDTIGGWLSEYVSALEVENNYSYKGFKFIIREMDGYRIRIVEIIKEA